MNTRAAAVKLGAFLIVTGLAAAYLGILLSESRTDGPETTVDAVFENVSFLQQGDPVRIAGVRVGDVAAIRLRRDATVSVTLTLSGAPALTDRTRAAIKYKNLIGDRYVELSEGSGQGRPLPARAVIPSAKTKPALDLDVLVGGFEPLFRALAPNQVNQLSGSLIQVLQGESGALSSFLGSVSSVTGSLADRQQVIGRVISNLNATLKTFSQRDEQVSDLIVQTRRLVDGLAADRAPLTGALDHVNALTASAADLLPRLRPDLAADVRHLGQVSRTLNEHKPEVSAALRELPEAYRAVSRIGVHGSFFNAYLCSVRVRFTGPTGETMYTPWLDSSVKRCSQKAGN